MSDDQNEGMPPIFLAAPEMLAELQQSAADMREFAEAFSRLSDYATASDATDVARRMEAVIQKAQGTPQRQQ